MSAYKKEFCRDCAKEDCDLANRAYFINNPQEDLGICDIGFTPKSSDDEYDKMIEEIENKFKF